VYLRYFHVEKLETRVAHERLIRKCCVDYDREMALVAERMDSPTGPKELLGVARLTRQRRPEEAELGALVSDHYQGAGLGTELLRRLVEIARAEKVKRVIAHIMESNAPMLALSKHFHFTLAPDEEPGCLIATLDL
jgi:acetyltransferase